MLVRVLRAYLNVRHMSQSELARRAGVSRQTVSSWLQSDAGELNIYTDHLKGIALALGINTEDLTKPLPVISDQKSFIEIETELLWDHLYSNIEFFISALLRGQSEAMARLVQTYGLYQSEKIIGRAVWDKFQKYKSKIHPAMRKQSEIIWNLNKSQILR